MKMFSIFAFSVVFLFNSTLSEATDKNLTGLQQGPNAVINGHRMIYLPELVPVPVREENRGNDSEKEIDAGLLPSLNGDSSRSLTKNAEIFGTVENLKTPANNEPEDSSTVVSTRGKIYGYVNGELAVVKKSSAVSLQQAESKSVSNFATSSGDAVVSYGGYVLYDTQRKQFELTEGIMQVEMNSAYKDANLENTYNLDTLYVSGNYHLVKAKNPDDFMQIYQQLSKDSRIEYVVMKFLPPKKTIQ